ncbi:MAG: hypothetical protein IJD48_04360 [Clostridia bacterium]|nr:hypothetical protein [Clostridia bacterium]
MSDFLKDYKNWENVGVNERKIIVKECAAFYDEKTVGYILSSLPKKKQKEFSKEPLEVVFVDKAAKPVVFGDNVITVYEDFLLNDKKDVCFKVAQSSICAVFVHLFHNTASDPNKKTRFGSIANGFLASITSEFAKGKEFESDMMQAYQEILGEVMDMGSTMEA